MCVSYAKATTGVLIRIGVTLLIALWICPDNMTVLHVAKQDLNT